MVAELVLIVSSPRLDLADVTLLASSFAALGSKTRCS